jgi:phosphoribosylanthranilate isomerase
MFVKICGVTNVADALQAAEAGADAVGMIFADSPRRIGESEGRAIVRALPPGVVPVAVFRSQPLDVIREVVEATEARGVQMHGAGPADLAALRDVASLVIEAVAAADGVAERLERSDADLVLVDSGSPGSGSAFDWSLLDGAARHRLVLAGGLHAGNVGEAVATVRPHGVDVASGVEAAVGKKDPEKVRLFVERARAARADGST